MIKSLLALLGLLACVQSTHRFKRAFTCPSDGKWPDPLDCGKFYTCQGSTFTAGWCGPGMSFDHDNQRCEMALAINCRDGERPDFKAPDGWEGKTKTTTTKKTTTTRLLETTTAKPDLNNGMKEGVRCDFKGQQPDKENCANYFYCKDGDVYKDSCVDRQLFDEETKTCKDFNKVYCGERPVNDKSKDQCKSRPNGVYPNLENGCVEFYQCSNQKKVKSGECPNGLKFNLLTLRCDHPSNVPIPCGQRSQSTNSAFIKISQLSSLVITLVFLLF